MFRQVLIIILSVIVIGDILIAQESLVREIEKSGSAYMNLLPPDDEAKLFEPDIFKEYLKTVPDNVLPFHSPIIFTPDLREAYWTPMIGGAGILFSKFADEKWTEPQKLEPGIKHGGLDPILSVDGNKLFFLSRQHPESEIRSRERIWFVEREKRGWSEAKPLDEIINNFSLHWTFSVAANGNLYFGSEGEIYCSEYLNNQYRKPRKLEQVINNDMNNSCPFIAPDESYLIFTRALESSDDLFISFKDESGNWGKAINLGEKINSEEAHDIAPRISPDGKYLFFLSKTTKAGMHWVNTDFIKKLRYK